MEAIAQEDGIEDLCEQCQGEASVHCQACSNSYCTTCNLVRHRVGKRRDHIFIRISTAGNVINTKPKQLDEDFSQHDHKGNCC